MPPNFTLTDASRAQARAAQSARRRAWALLPLRQTFADEDHMRGYLLRAGIRPPERIEPATVRRLRILLRRANISQPEAEAAIGCTLEHFLVLNPNLPLWAATALVLESAH